jgi:hypothetical protein
MGLSVRHSRPLEASGWAPNDCSGPNTSPTHLSYSAELRSRWGDSMLGISTSASALPPPMGLLDCVPMSTPLSEDKLTRALSPMTATKLGQGIPV